MFIAIDLFAHVQRRVGMVMVVLLQDMHSLVGQVVCSQRNSVGRHPCERLPQHGNQQQKCSDGTRHVSHSRGNKYKTDTVNKAPQPHPHRVRLTTL